VLSSGKKKQGVREEKSMDHQLIQRAARDILQSKRTIAFTGAGISVESGIPDFRGAEGPGRNTIRKSMPISMPSI